MSSRITKYLMTQTGQDLWEGCITNLSSMRYALDHLTAALWTNVHLLDRKVVERATQMDVEESAADKLTMSIVFDSRRADLREMGSPAAQLALTDEQERWVRRDHEDQEKLAATFALSAKPVFNQCFEYHAGRVALVAQKDLRSIVGECWAEFYQANPEDNLTNEARCVSLVTAMGKVYDLFRETAQEMVRSTVHKRPFTEAQMLHFNHSFNAIMDSPEAFRAG